VQVSRYAVVDRRRERLSKV